MPNVLRGHWCWCKYGCDFVKEDGEWRLWHYHVHRVFRSPYDINRVKEYDLKQSMAPSLDEYTLPTTYDHPYSWKYEP